MSHFVGFPQPASAHMGVNLGRGQTLVPQQLLNAPEVSPPVQQMSGKGVPQRMRRRLLRKTSSRNMRFQHAANAAGREPPPKSIEKQGITLLFRSTGVRVPDFHPAIKRPGGIAANRRDPLLSPLTQNSQDPRTAIPVAAVQSDQLRDTKPGRIHGFKNRAITESGGGVGGWCGEELSDLVGGEEVRQLAACARCAKWLGGVAFAEAFAAAVTEEGSKTGEPSGGGGPCIATFMEPGDVLPEYSHVDGRDLGKPPKAFLQEFLEVLQVIEVGFEREGRRIAFDLEVVKELSNGGFHGA